MASNWVSVELQQLSGSGNTRKDSLEKFKKIFQKILGSKENTLHDLKVFIEAGMFMDHVVQSTNSSYGVRWYRKLLTESYRIVHSLLG